jgi:two-component system, sensor histidine kinase and response regulator
MKKILVIEDDKSVREIIVALLDAENYDVINAENGSIGVEVAQKEIPDLVICDVVMPQLDGLSVLKILRKNPITMTIPFIFLTGNTDKQDFRVGMELGADDYLTKPFSKNELLAAINSRLEKQFAIRQESQKRLDDLRSSITLSLPHEMRSPVSNILGFSQLLIDESEILEPQAIRDIASGIHNSAERLFKLIQNFLLYAELEVISTDPQRIKSLNNKETKFPTDQFTDLIKTTAQKVGREADLQVYLQPCYVKISSSRLSKIIEELIDNAFKFSPKGSTVHITSRLMDNSLTLSIIDYGRGMTATQIAELGAYRQFERKLYEQKGSGLGLIIAKRLIELHGGQLNFQSTPGEKTVVQVMLPCRGKAMIG